MRDRWVPALLHERNDETGSNQKLARNSRHSRRSSYAMKKAGRGEPRQAFDFNDRILAIDAVGFVLQLEAHVRIGVGADKRGGGTPAEFPNRTEVHSRGG